MIRLIVADDHQLIRDGLVLMFRQAEMGVEIVGKASNGREVIELLEKKEADVVLMDIDMPEMNGIEATRVVRERFPEVKVLMLSMLDNEKYVLDATQAGAQGYVLKTASYRELQHALRTVAEGEEYFSTDIAKMLLRKMQAAPPAPSGTHGRSGFSDGGTAGEKLPANISPRELEVLRLIAQGHTNNQIGEMLFTSRRTVETHRQNLLEKTGTNNTATLILFAVNNGLLE